MPVKTKMTAKNADEHPLNEDKDIGRVAEEMKKDPDLKSQPNNIVESKGLGLQFTLPYKFSVIKYDIDNGDIRREDKFAFKATSLKEAYQKF